MYKNKKQNKFNLAMMMTDYSNTVSMNNADPPRVKSLDDVIVRHKRVAKMFSDSATATMGGCVTGFPVLNWDDWRCFLRVSLRNCDGITKTSNSRDTETSDEESETGSEGTNYMFES
jgi:hypothetical protein